MGGQGGEEEEAVVQGMRAACRGAGQALGGAISHSAAALLGSPCDQRGLGHSHSTSWSVHPGDTRALLVAGSLHFAQEASRTQALRKETMSLHSCQCPSRTTVSKIKESERTNMKELPSFDA